MMLVALYSVVVLQQYLLSINYVYKYWQNKWLMVIKEPSVAPSGGLTVDSVTISTLAGLLVINKLL